MTADVLYAATDQGVFRSPDAGISWSRCSESKVTTSVLVLQDGRTVLAGTSDGSVLRSVDSGDHWTAITRGIPGVSVSILASRFTGPAMVYVGTNEEFAASNDAGLTWVPRNIGLVATTPVESPTPRTEIAALLPDADTPGTVILSLLGQGFYVTKDDGNRWKRLQLSMNRQAGSTPARTPRVCMSHRTAGRGGPGPAAGCRPSSPYRERSTRSRSLGTASCTLERRHAERRCHGTREPRGSVSIAVFQNLTYSISLSTATACAGWTFMMVATWRQYAALGLL
jgi:hypothetical protein